jgi:prolyl-tRNA editing enzyme YbaK/EbsC (Cys-tRNA(Pro) deacylase)
VTLDIRVFDESTHTAAEAAAAVGADIGQIVKSLVFVAPNDADGLDPILCLVSGPNRVDLARLAAVTGEKDVRRATAREANELTGFSIGGIPPIGHSQPIRVVMDPDLGRYPVVWAAAGTPTAVFPVSPATLRTLANATVAPLAADAEPDASALESSSTPAG